MHALIMLLATTFLVSRAGDDPGAGTLRWAIEQVNATPATKATRATIRVATPMTVAPAQPLPALTQPAVLDFTNLTLDGTAAGGNGLFIAANDAYLSGGKIVNFGGSGIVLAGDNNLVSASEIDANGTGISVRGVLNTVYGSKIRRNRGDGIHVYSGADGTTLGGLETPCPFECPYVPYFDTVAENGGHGVVTEGRWTRIYGIAADRNLGDGILILGADAAIHDSGASFNVGNGITAKMPLADFATTIGACNGKLFLDERGDGPTANDTPDADGVANAPHIDSAIDDLTAVTVAGTLDALPATPYRVDVVAISCDDGAANIGSIFVETDSHGFASFRRAFYKAGSRYNVRSVAATATDYRIDLVPRPQPFATSELSAPVAAAANRDHRADVSARITSAPATAKPGEQVTFEIVVTNHGPAAVEFELEVPHVAGALYDRGTTTSGACYLDGIEFCGIGPLAPGESATVRNVVTLPTHTGIFPYRAEVKLFAGSSDSELDASNNAAAWNVDVQVQPRRRSAAH
ncbi:MAG TPA: right-handed parallel beta-helix repeat-containing protein [Thermoanaerobaculia bacterium]|nr:right-handed parallel beta-helix repeat-containing protein [Thermoanaerobaculia bacterium]